MERRDFLNGVALAVPAALLSPREILGLGDSEAYPPGLTGMRGSHDGSWEVAHALRDGQAFSARPGRRHRRALRPRGGGRRALRPRRRLVLPRAGGEGRARPRPRQPRRLRRPRQAQRDDGRGPDPARERGRAGDRVGLALSGPMPPVSCAPWGWTGRGTRPPPPRPPGPTSRAACSSGVFFDRETFGEDRLVAGRGQVPWPEFLARCPLAEAARRDLARLYDDRANPDYLPGLSSAEKKARLARMSYAAFLRDLARVDPDVLPFFQADTHDLFCRGHRRRARALPAGRWATTRLPGHGPRAHAAGDPARRAGRAARPPAAVGRGSTSTSRTATPPSPACSCARSCRRRCPAPPSTTSSPPAWPTTAWTGKALRAASACAAPWCGWPTWATPAGAREVEVVYVQDGQVRTVRAAALRPRLLERGHPPSLPGAARAASGRPWPTGSRRPSSTRTCSCGLDRLRAPKVASVTAPGSYHSTFFLAEPVAGGRTIAPRARPRSRPSSRWCGPPAVRASRRRTSTAPGATTCSPRPSPPSSGR